MHLKSILCVALCGFLISCSSNPSNETNSKNDTEVKKQSSIKKADTEAAKAAALKAQEQAKQEAAAKAAKAKANADKAAAEKAAALKAQEQAKQAAAAKAAKAKANADRAAAEKAAALKAQEQAKQAAAAKAAKAKANADRAAAEKAAALKAQEQAKQAAAAKAAKTKASADKAAAEKAAALKAQEQAKQAAAAKAAKAKANADRAAAEKAAALKAQEQAKQAAAAKAAKAQRDALIAKANAKKSTTNNTASVSNDELGTGVIKVNKSEAASLLGTKYTPMGAIKEGNADGSIPAWSGNMLGAPAGIAHKPQAPHADPYANEKPLFTIHSGNFQKYAANLSEGQKALFKKYPDTFAMPVYKTHRDGRYNKKIETRTAWNATKTKLVNGLDGLNSYTGGAPFPFPQNAAEVLWNARIIHPHQALVGRLDDVAVYLNGNTQLRRQKLVMDFPFAHPDNLVGQVDEQIGINAGLIHITLEEPKRQKGQMTIIHEALDQVKNERKAWVYLTGSRRVRRAPTVGFDTPDGPGGLVTVDDALGFNGAMVRFDWKLVGKKEVYIPYHNYKFDSPRISYDTLLTKGHANPDYMRYEKHRVWIVEADLKQGARHVYAKRRFYIDEDSWQLAIVESYDGRGDLWRVGLLNSIYDFSVEGFIARAQVFHDLQSGAYVANRLLNETGVPDYKATPRGENYYSPANLRKLGK